MLEQLNAWHWFILAVVLMILEVFSPGAFMLWIGLAAAMVGVIMLGLPEIQWQYQLLSFAALSVGAIVAAREILKRRPIQTDQPHLNRRGEQYIGRSFTLQEPIINNEGKIRVDDSTWKVRGDDCPAGQQIVVTGVDGVVLKVQHQDS